MIKEKEDDLFVGFGFIFLFFFKLILEYIVDKFFVFIIVMCEMFFVILFFIFLFILIFDIMFFENLCEEY